MQVWDVARPLLVLGGFLAVAGSMLWASYRSVTEGSGLWAQHARLQVRIGRVIAPLGAGMFAIGFLTALTSWIW